MVRLLVLWLLSERSSYGYEIKRSLTDGGMGFWFRVEDASIYSALRTLEKHGHARRMGEEKVGARPPRTRYAITPEGRRLYHQLLTDALVTVALPTSPVDVALAARGDIDAADLEAGFAARRVAVVALISQIELHRTAAPSDAIADRNLAILRAELTWLDDLDPQAIS